jgi:hypothetical protein
MWNRLGELLIRSKSTVVPSIRTHNRTRIDGGTVDRHSQPYSDRRWYRRSALTTVLGSTVVPSIGTHDRIPNRGSAWDWRGGGKPTQARRFVHAGSTARHSMVAPLGGVVQRSRPPASTRRPATRTRSAVRRPDSTPVRAGMAAACATGLSAPRKRAMRRDEVDRRACPVVYWLLPSEGAGAGDSGSAAPFERMGFRSV